MVILLILIIESYFVVVNAFAFEVNVSFFQVEFVILVVVSFRVVVLEVSYLVGPFV
jgi:hypothetical protein